MVIMKYSNVQIFIFEHPITSEMYNIILSYKFLCIIKGIRRRGIVSIMMWLVPRIAGSLMLGQWHDAEYVYMKPFKMDI